MICAGSYWRRTNKGKEVCGSWLPLAAHRNKTGVSLKQIAKSTKISPCFLRAIGAGEYDQLPGGIFSTSYIRQYAAAICFDERELLAHYRSRSGANPGAVAHPPGTQTPKTWEKKQTNLG